MADEDIRLLDGLPQKLPSLSLWSTRRGNEIASNLDMTSVNDGPIRRALLYERDQEWQLRVIYDDYVGAALNRMNQGTISLEPGKHLQLRNQRDMLLQPLRSWRSGSL